MIFLISLSFFLKTKFMNQHGQSCFHDEFILSFSFCLFRDRLKRDIIYKNPFDDAYVFKEPNSRDQTTINMNHSGFIFKKTH